MRAEGRVRILVVEDDKTSRENLAELLEAEGPYDISTAGDGATALELIASGPAVDVVITDIKMPGADGVEVLRAAKSKQPETAVIMLTGYGSLETATAAVRAGAFAYLLKPIDFDNLVALVGEAASKVRLLRENRDLTERLAAANEELTRGIAQQLEANQRLRRAQAALAEHEKMRALGQLVAGIAHELRNPLTGIIGLTEAIIRDGALTKDDADDLGAVKDLGLRCRDIIENLLRFARGEKLIKGAVPVRSIIDDVLKLVEHEVRLATIDVLLDVPAGTPDLFANRNQIGQVLLNLVRNALEAMSDQSTPKKLSIVASRAEDRVRIVVADTGPGLGDASRLFEPFFTTKELGKGTGLGLAISRGIVEEGGRIAAENGPLGAPVHHRDPRQRRHRAAGCSGAAPLGGFRALPASPLGRRRELHPPSDQPPPPQPLDHRGGLPERRRRPLVPGAPGVELRRDPHRSAHAGGLRRLRLDPVDLRPSARDGPPLGGDDGRPGPSGDAGSVRTPPTQGADQALRPRRALGHDLP
jgi:signal transduction histidine kinase